MMTATIDLLTRVPSLSVERLDKGFVRLVDVMPRIVPLGTTADHAVIQAARVSYSDGTKTLNEDRGLIRYLMRHQHTTPFEMVEFKFHCKMPIFVARQWIRHRTANVNEVSGRYSVLKDDFYLPDVSQVRQQSKTNKQGGDSRMDQESAADFIARLDRLCASSYAAYLGDIDRGVSREQARMQLPLNLYTEWYWKIDLHNLFHFLALRCDAHAQWEIRTFADAMLELITPVAPWSVEAWNDYHPMRGAMKLTRLEIEAIRKALAGATVPHIESDNKRECEEWAAKVARLKA